MTVTGGNGGKISRRKRRYVANFLKRGRWWVAWTDDVPGALTQGRTLKEARENLKDAIALMLEPLEPGVPAEYSSRLLTETLIL